MLDWISWIIRLVFVLILVSRIALGARFVLDSCLRRLLTFILQRIRIEGERLEVEFRSVLECRRLRRLKHVRNVLRLAIEPLISAQDQFVLVIDHGQITDLDRGLIAHHLLCQRHFLCVIDLNTLSQIKLEIFHCVVHSSIEIGEEFLALIRHSNIDGDARHCKLLWRQLRHSLFLLPPEAMRELFFLR